MIYIGIDPGASGGLACIRTGLDCVRGDPQPVLEAVSMPPTEKDIWYWIVQEESANEFAVIEKVGGFIGVPHPGSAMFKFGQSYGGLRMALIAAGIPFDEVTPQRWQKALGISSKKPHTKKKKVQISKGKNKGKWKIVAYGGESNSDFKNRLKAKAQQLFPKLGVTLKTCDAILLAEYCRRLKEGEL